MAEEKPKNSPYNVLGLFLCLVVIAGLISLILGIISFIHGDGSRIGSALFAIASALCFTGGLRAMVDFTKD